MKRKVRITLGNYVLTTVDEMKLHLPYIPYYKMHAAFKAIVPRNNYERLRIELKEITNEEKER